MEVSVLPKISAEQLSGIRAEFPILQQKVNNHALVYLDNSATTQKPLSVINAVSDHYKKNNSNIHRGVHSLSQRSTEAYEQAREKVREHINASKTSEVIFTKGTTESINLVAHALGRKVVGKGDEVLVTMMEHHSNILPWQRLCEENGALLKVVNILEDGQLDLDDFKKKLNKSTKIVAFTHVSNTLGTINPVKELVHSVKEVGAYCVVDGAQAIPHMKVDVQELNCDFYCFSGHKAYAPSGIGVLFSKESLLQKMDLYQTGGGTIKTVSFESTEYAESPLKYEAGTPPIEAAIGLGAALDFINAIGIEAISKHENELLEKATQALSSIDGLRVIGEAPQKAAVLSFVVDGIHPFDIGTILDKMGVAVRTGHHCTQPLMGFYNIPGTVRASFGLYNSEEEVNRLVEAVNKAVKMLS